MAKNTKTENFWKREYRDDYMRKNAEFNLKNGVKAWHEMLNKTSEINTILECGCNTGRNIDFLQNIDSSFDISAIDVNSKALEFVQNKFGIKNIFNGRIEDSNFDDKTFDLVFTMGVLIHIDPEELLANTKKIFDYSSKYILIGEYFNRTPTTITYQGQEGLLFKRDFGKFFLENHNLEVIDHGFLWGHYYDDSGFDDFTWWLFKKNC